MSEIKFVIKEDSTPGAPGRILESEIGSLRETYANISSSITGVTDYYKIGDKTTIVKLTVDENDNTNYISPLLEGYTGRFNFYTDTPYTGNLFKINGIDVNVSYVDGIIEAGVIYNATITDTGIDAHFIKKASNYVGNKILKGVTSGGEVKSTVSSIVNMNVSDTSYTTYIKFNSSENITTLMARVIFVSSIGTIMFTISNYNGKVSLISDDNIANWSLLYSTPDIIGISGPSSLKPENVIIERIFSNAEITSIDVTSDNYDTNTFSILPLKSKNTNANEVKGYARNQIDDELPYNTDDPNHSTTIDGKMHVSFKIADDNYNTSFIIGNGKLVRKVGNGYNTVGVGTHIADYNVYKEIEGYEDTNDYTTKSSLCTLISVTTGQANDTVSWYNNNKLKYGVISRFNVPDKDNSNYELANKQSALNGYLTIEENKVYEIAGIPVASYGMYIVPSSDMNKYKCQSGVFGNITLMQTMLDHSLYIKNTDTPSKEEVWHSRINTQLMENNNTSSVTTIDSQFLVYSENLITSDGVYITNEETKVSLYKSGMSSTITLQVPTKMKIGG